MFGNFFGQPQREIKQPATAPDEGMSDLEIRNVLGDLVDVGQTITSEDYQAIRTRARKLTEKKYGFDAEVYIKLAFIDRAMMLGKSLGIHSYEESFHNIDMVRPFISDEALSRDDVFLKTVLVKAEDLYTSGAQTLYSEALFAAITDRVHEVKNSVVEGTIHNDGVVNVQTQ